MAHSPPTDLNRRLFALYIGTKSKNRKKQSHRHQFASSPTAFDVSKDPMDKLIRFRERDHLTFPLLSDADLTVHRLYGAYGEKKLYGKVYEGVIRSTFVIDGDGVIRVPRYNVRERPC